MRGRVAQERRVVVRPPSPRRAHLTNHQGALLNPAAPFDEITEAAQHQLFGALSASAGPPRSPQAVMSSFDATLDAIENHSGATPRTHDVRDIPECVTQDLPPTSASELATIMGIYKRLGHHRRVFFSAIGAVISLEAATLALASSSVDARNIAVRHQLIGDSFEAPSHSPLVLARQVSEARHPSPRRILGAAGYRFFRQFLDPRRNGGRSLRYWNPPAIGAAYSGSDHDFAVSVIEGELFAAKDRVMRRLGQERLSRDFLLGYAALHRHHVTLRKWLRKHTDYVGPGPPPLETLDEAIAGVVAETMAFVLHGINGWLDAIVLLWDRLDGEARGRLALALDSVGAFQNNLFENRLPLFLLPASLSASSHGALLHEIRGNPNPYKSGLLQAELVLQLRHLRSTVIGAWQVGDPGLQRALDAALLNPANCGGLTLHHDLNKRSELAKSLIRFLSGMDRDQSLSAVDVHMFLGVWEHESLAAKVRARIPWTVSSFPFSPLSDVTFDSGRFELARPELGSWARYGEGTPYRGCLHLPPGVHIPPDTHLRPPYARLPPPWNEVR